MKNAAIVLAGGSGSRMKSRIKKQYQMIGEHPVLWYSLHVFEQCPRIEEIVLVCGAGETDLCREQYVRQYDFQKIRHIVEGGTERCHSVYNGLKAAEDCAFVLIHDSARPFIDQAMLNRILDTLEEYPACVAGMPVKDTIKIRDEDDCVEQTLPREKLWMIQTPQAFSYPLIRQAYDKLERQEIQADGITDDAMVLEKSADVRVKLVEGSYSNIKITTPEDLIMAESLLFSKKGVDRFQET